MNWEKGLEIQPDANINGHLVTIQNVRDFHYRPREIVSEGYIDSTFDVDSISGAWFMLMPFSRHKGVGHSFATFDFKDQNPVVLSAEARKKPGEVWSPWKGLWPYYPLMNVWASETDETVRRVIMLKKEVYMLPILAPNEVLADFFLQTSQETANLLVHPKKYNTVFRNCTNTLARSANRARPGTIPYDKARLLPGFAPQLLHKLGYIPNDRPVEQIMERYKIGQHVHDLYDQADFSKKLRERLAS